jgi:hypothetical protein
LARDGHQIMFVVGPNNKAFGTQATVLNWEAGPSPLMVVPADQSRWMILQSELPETVCTSVSASITVVVRQWETKENEFLRPFESEERIFCVPSN